MRRYACSFDWDRVLNTCDPEYYRWNQWLFLQMFERGLAYRKASRGQLVPDDQTVLANEQVVGGLCERCDTPVTKKKLTQWYLKITDYADRLLDDMEQLEGSWPEKVLPMQRNWIGRSTGADVAVRHRGPRGAGHRLHDPARHAVRRHVLRGRRRLRPGRRTGRRAPRREAEFAAYLEQVTRQETDIERLATDRQKTGVFLHRYAINPVNGERMPIWAADYVLADYGTGAIMAVPAHDQRDLDFARHVRPAGPGRGRRRRQIPWRPAIATAGDGAHVNSGPLDGLARTRRSRAIIEWLEQRGPGRAAVNYRLRDWLISPPAVLGHADPDHPLPGLRRGPGARGPAARGAARRHRPGPQAQGQPRRWAPWTTGSTSTARAAAGRRDATPTRWTRSSTRPGTSCATSTRAQPTARSIPTQADALAAGRPVRRRRDARDPAPAVRAVLHQGAARHGHARLRGAVHRACSTRAWS